MNILDRIPAAAREAIYGPLGFCFTVESTLDVFDYGLVPAKPQAAAIAVLAAPGFGLAFKHVPAGDPLPPPAP